MIVVPDASAVGAFLLPDEAGPFAALALETCRTAALHVPPHWRVEIASLVATAVRRRRIAPSDGQRIARRAEALANSVTVGSAVGIDRLAACADAFGLSAYDAAYLLLAQDAQASLLTADGPLARAARESGVALIAP